MKLQALLQDISVTAMTVSADTEINHIRYDSRLVQPGDLFVAVEGLLSDGHRFIPMAVEKGAAAVLCQRVPEGDVPYILTPDTRKALALVSAAHFEHPAHKLCMIGVTGTNGKTTSTILIKHLLEDCLGAKVGLIGTISNWIGNKELPTERTTPESYDLQALLHQMVEAGCTHAVMEVSSHALALERVAGIEFQVGLFTNLTQDHLDFHKTMENYAQAKAKLFAVSRTGAVNLDDPWAPFMQRQAQCPILGFGLEPRQGGIYAQDIAYAASGVTFTAVEGAQRQRIHLGIPGKFSVSNALTVLACARLLDIPLARAGESLSRAKGVKGRMEVVPTGTDFTILIDYAHTPDALEKVLQAVRAVTDHRVVALFGCGGDRDGTKRPIMGRIAAENADFTIVTSDNPRTEDPAAIIRQIVAGMPADAPKEVILDRPTAIGWAIAHHQPGDVIVLAGKGHETYQDVGGQKHHMDEREIVAAYLQG
jgi:UDP-N-acetylmuramoyl-L-alanyl-D-glutamate--2,6-diaminopimelate ligase